MIKKIILASQSPRRRELVTLLNMPFTAVSPIGDETLDESLSIREQIEDLAKRKAQSVYADNDDGIIIGSDTVVVLDGKILGKPNDEEDAKAMLRALSGRSHEVVTGVALMSSERQSVFSVITKVTFYPISEEEVQRYVASKEPMDKAGSYSIQGGASLFVERIEGDYYTVMGLPISRVYQELIHNVW